MRSRCRSKTRTRTRTPTVTFSFCPTTRRYIGLPSFPSPPSSHRASVLLRSNLAETIPSCCLLSCTIFIWCHDTHLRATHTTTSSIGGVQIPIYLVSSATDSIRSRVVLFKTVTIPTSDVTFSCCPTTRRYIGLPSLLSPPSSHRASVLLRSNLAETIPSCCLLPCTIFIWCHDTISHVRYTSASHSYDY